MKQLSSNIEPPPDPGASHADGRHPLLFAIVAASALAACSKKEEAPPPPAAAPAPAPAAEAPAAPKSWNVYAFKIGELSAMALRDGGIEVPNDNKVFGVGRTPEEVAAVLSANGLPTDKLRSPSIRCW